MNMRLMVAAFALGLWTTACVKEVSSEERLERETTKIDLKEALGAKELQKIKCDDTSAKLAKARNENKPETDRVLDYIDLFQTLKGRGAKFDEAMTRNPDLAYQEGSQELIAAKDQCVQQAADVRLEFEGYVRGLVEVPIVQEFKGGATVTVARLDFETLKKAIETLDPDDRDSLLQKVTNAEKKIEVKAESRKKTK